MRVSRRSFVRALGIGGAGLATAPVLGARGREALAEWAPQAMGSPAATARAVAPAVLRLDSNENPNGPGPAALRAVRAAFDETARYPRAPADALLSELSAFHGVSAEQIALGCGSGEILRMAAYAFTSPTRPMVTGAPSFEDPARHALTAGAEVRAVPVDAALRLDLDAMAAQATGSGLVFLCNPNNPTATVHGAATVEAFVERVVASSPETTILIDEAYHEYVEDPEYASAIPLASRHAQVIVVRTFSKVYGMAGLRIGYAIAQPEAIRAIQRFKLPNSINVLGAAAALAALRQRRHVERERALNREAREYTRQALEALGYPANRSETNFLMVDVRRDARDFREACLAQEVAVGRPFPPLTTHARISIGTMREMRRALAVFRSVLA